VLSNNHIQCIITSFSTPVGKGINEGRT